MAAEAAHLAHQVVAAEQLGGLFLAAVADQVGHLVMALQTGGLDEPAGQHREVPEMIVGPAVLLAPLLFLAEVGRRVGGQAEAGGAALAVVADGAADLLGGVRAVGIDEQVEPGMGGVHRHLGRRQLHCADLPGQVAQVEAELLAAFLAIVEQLARPAQPEVGLVGFVRQGVQLVPVERGPLDAQVTGGAAIVARHVLEAAVFDGQVVQMDLVDPGRRGKAIEDRQRADAVVDGPGLLRRALGKAIERGCDPFEVFLGVGQVALQGFQLLADLFTILLLSRINRRLGLLQLVFQPLDLLLQLLSFLLREAVLGRLRSGVTNVLHRNVVVTGLRVQVGLDFLVAGIVVVALDQVFLLRRRHVLFLVGQGLAGGDDGLFPDLDQLRVGQVVDHLPFAQGRLHVAELALDRLVLPVIVVREHPDTAKQHRHARNREDDVHHPLIAIRFISRSHDLSQMLKKISGTYTMYFRLMVQRRIILIGRAAMNSSRTIRVM